jgi:DNA-binding NarL/FixJ family response regulator
MAIKEAEVLADPQPAGKPIRVLAADDHPVFLAGLAALMEMEPDLELVGEASSGRETIQQYSVLRPDITLLDLQMPDGGGIEAITKIRAESPAARIIILTTYAGDARARGALKAGAQGYLLKGMIRKELFDCIRAVHAGRRRIHVEVAHELATHCGEDSLSEREVQVLAHIATGNSNRNIADLLSITEETVKGHVRTIFAKLGASDRTHAVMIAISRGFLQI